MYATHNISMHSFKMGELIKRRIDEWFEGEGYEERRPTWLRRAHPDDPFMPHYLKKPWEMLYPPVPADKLVRGLLYLHSHGDELIRSESMTTS